MRACRGGNGWSGGPGAPEGQVTVPRAAPGRKGRRQVTGVVQGIGFRKHADLPAGGFSRQGANSVAGSGSHGADTSRKLPGRPSVRSVQPSSKRYLSVFSGRRPGRSARPSPNLAASRRGPYPGLKESPLSRAKPQRIDPTTRRPLSPAQQARHTAMGDELWSRCVEMHAILSAQDQHARAAPCPPPIDPANPD